VVVDRAARENAATIFRIEMRQIALE